MTSTEMMNDKFIKEELILMNLTKSMKINSNFDHIDELVSRPKNYSIDSMRYMMPSFNEEEINNLMNKSFSINCLKSSNKRLYYKAINNNAQKVNKSNATNDNQLDISFSNIKNKEFIDSIIEDLEVIKLNKALREYYLVKITNKIQKKIEDNYKFQKLKEQIETLNSQIKEKEEEEKKLSRTLKETKQALQREIERQAIQKIMVNRIEEMRKNRLKNN